MLSECWAASQWCYMERKTAEKYLCKPKLRTCVACSWISRVSAAMKPQGHCSRTAKDGKNQKCSTEISSWNKLRNKLFPKPKATFIWKWKNWCTPKRSLKINKNAMSMTHPRVQTRLWSHCHLSTFPSFASRNLHQNCCQLFHRLSLLLNSCLLPQYKLFVTKPFSFCFILHYIYQHNRENRADEDLRRQFHLFPVFKAKSAIHFFPWKQNCLTLKEKKKTKINKSKV